MAVSDLLMPLFAMPIMITDQIYGPFSWHVGGPAGQVACKLLPFFQDVSTAVLIESLVIITMDRFHAFVFPLKTFMGSKGPAVIAIAMTWTIAAIIQSPYFYTYRLVTIQGMFYCYQNWEPAFDNQQSPKILFVFLFIAFFAAPFVFIAVSYSAIIAKLRCQRTAVMPAMNTNNRVRRQKQQKNVLKMSVVVVLIFALLHFPFFLYVFLWQYKFTHPICGYENYFFILRFLVHLVGAINPAVYFVFSANFRRGLGDLCCQARARRGPTHLIIHVQAPRGKPATSQSP